MLLEHSVGGSIAGTACNPCGSTEGNQLIVKEILKNIYWRNERVLGKAVFAAKCSLMVWYPTNDNYYGTAYLYTLFGDPALRIKYPMNTSVREGKIDISPDQLNQCPTVIRNCSHLTSKLPAVVFNIYGCQVSCLRSGNDDIRNLPPGIYFIKQQDLSNSTKIVVVR